MDEHKALRAERQALAETLETLTPQQWDTQSLCSEWRVRDVVAHLVDATSTSVMAFLAGMAKNGFRMNRFLARSAQQRGAQPTDRLLAEFRSIVDSERRPPGTKPIHILTDNLVHGQDIRRPLAIARDLPEESARAVADTLKRAGFPLGTKKRIAGLRLQATDIDWSTGDGPEARGPIAALIMVMAGRPAALADLDGEGAETLRSRT